MEKLDCSAENNWTETLEGLIAGVSHHIGNRVAVLAGVAEILGEDESIPPILRALVDEVPRLEEGVRLLGLLGRDGWEREEALEVGRIVRDAAALARLHLEVRRDVVVEIGDVAPVVAVPSVLLRQIVGMMVHACREDANAVVRCVEVGDVVEVVGGEGLVVRAKALR